MTAEALQWPADRRAWLHITQMLGRFLGGRGGRRPAWLLLDDADAWDEEPPSGSRGASAAAIAKALLQAPVPASGHRIVALVHSPRAWLSTVLADSLEATCRATPRRPYGSPTTAVSDGTTDCGEAWTRLRIPQAEDRLVVAAAVQALAPAAAPAAAVLWQARAAHAARAATFRYVAAHLQHSMAAAAVWGGWLGAGGGAARAASKAVAQLLAHRPPPASLAAAASDYARTLRVLHCVSDGDGGVVVTAGTAGTAGTCRHCGLNWDEAAAGVVTGGVPRHWLVGCSMQGLGAARLGAVGALAGLASDLDVLAAERWRRGGRHSVAGAAAVEEDAAVAVLGVHVLRAAAAGRPAGAATPLRYQRDPAAAVRRQRGFLELETNSVLRSAAAAGASTERRRRLQAAAALQVSRSTRPAPLRVACGPRACRWCWRGRLRRWLRPLCRRHACLQLAPLTFCWTRQPAACTRWRWRWWRPPVQARRPSHRHHGCRGGHSPLPPPPAG